MSILGELIEDFKNNKQNKKENKKNSISYPFKKLEDELCGIQKGQMIGFTGASGVGKSRVGRYMFVYNSIRFAMENNYKLKIIYFLLEDNPKRIGSFFVSNYLFNNYKSRVSSHILFSSGKNELNDNILDRIKENEKEIDKIFSYVDFVRDYTTPDEINNYLHKVSLQYGTYSSVKEYVDGVEKEKQVYTPKDDTHILVIVDNLSNVMQDKCDIREYDAVTRLCREVLRKKYADLCKFTIVNIIQQALAVEAQQFTNGGQLVIPKLIPSMSTIGDNKIIVRMGSSFFIQILAFVNSMYYLCVIF